jgi:hypothetical protein
MLRWRALASFAPPERCTLWKAQFGNVFDDRGEPEEAKSLSCPAGTSTQSARYTQLPKESFLSAPGWVLRCMTDDGRSEGPLVTWSRQGKTSQRSRFANNLRDGVTVLTSTQETLQLEFTEGVVKKLPPGDEQIVVAARDLPAGTRLTREHLSSTLAAPLLQLWVVTPSTFGVAKGAKLGVALKQGIPQLHGAQPLLRKCWPAERLIDQRTVRLGAHLGVKGQVLTALDLLHPVEGEVELRARFHQALLRVVDGPLHRHVLGRLFAGDATLAQLVEAGLTVTLHGLALRNFLLALPRELLRRALDAVEASPVRPRVERVSRLRLEVLHLEDEFVSGGHARTLDHPLHDQLRASCSAFRENC